MLLQHGDAYCFDVDGVAMLVADGRSLVCDAQLKFHQVARSSATALVARFSAENNFCF